MPITTSTVQSIRDSFRKRVKSSYSQCDPQQVLSFQREPRGRPSLLGTDIDRDILEYVEAMRKAGAVVNRKIIAGVAMGVILAKRPSLLKEKGGCVDFVGNSKLWVDSFMRRANLVKRKGTKAAKKLPLTLIGKSRSFLQGLQRR